MSAKIHYVEIFEEILREKVIFTYETHLNVTIKHITPIVFVTCKALLKSKITSF